MAELAGERVGPEVTNEAVKVLKKVAEKFGHTFTFTEGKIGAIAIDATGDPFPPETQKLCEASDAVLFGAIGDPKYDNDPKATVRPEQGLLRMRKVLGLYANVRPIYTFDIAQSKSPLKPEITKDVNFVVIRELTGGIYFGEKGRTDNGRKAFDTCTYTIEEITQVAKFAFDLAKTRNKKPTLVDKENVLETSRLWRETIQQMVTTYPDIAVDYMFVDNAAMQIILHPAQFDVIVTENLFGDILSDEASVLSGSLGLLPSASVGNTTALFEPIHGSYPQAAGKDIANPLGSILSAAMMLDHFQMTEEATAVREAVSWTLEHGFVSKDIDAINNYATTAIGDLITDHIERHADGDRLHGHASLNQSTII